jgi:16S rRNA (uracil1498-N3)-methyltransferase
MAIQPRSADEALFAAIERHQGKTLLDPENNISSASVALIVGPEGGFTDAEIALMKASPTITPITLGANVLRAETAILAGLSCFSMRNQKRAY